MKTMIEILIIIFIIGNINSKLEATDIVFGEEIHYDKNNNKFMIKTTDDEPNLIIHITVENAYSTLISECINPNGGSTSTDYTMRSPGLGQLLTLENGEYCTYTITSNGDEKGTIWVYPLNRELNIDLNQKYGKMFTLLGLGFKEYTPFTYVVSNLKYDTTIKFKYATTFTCEFFTMTGLTNPFKICHGDGNDDCKENISTYTFKKQENYKIYIQFQKKSANMMGTEITYNVMPGYTFFDPSKYDDNETSGSKLLSLSLIYIILILIQFI